MNPIFLVIDLFCGAGGVTTGFDQARIGAGKAAKVIACINHDELAIASHQSNHKELKHFTEDIRTLDLTELISIVNSERKKYFSAKLILWASLECTNFSKAKGGQSRDADSRTLAEHLYRYIDQLSPDYVQIENVVEFMSWGKLNEHGKPVSMHKGCDYLRWVRKVKSFKYKFSFMVLNAADYGAHTTRKRYFGIFARPELPVIFPLPTHEKNPSTESTLFPHHLKKWRPVKEVLDFSDEGNSILTRKKSLSEKTLARIYAGLIKYIAGGEKSFIAKTYATASNGHGTYSTDKTGHTVTTRDAQHLVQPKFLLKYHGHGKNIIGVNEPCSTITTKDRLAKVETTWLDKHYSGKDNHQSIEKPAGAILTKDKYAIIKTKHFIYRQFSNGGESRSIESPAGSLLSVPKTNLITAEKFIVDTSFNNKPKSMDEPAPTVLASRRHHYLVNPQWGINGGGSVENPCFTIIARMDKTPPYLVTTETGQLAISVETNDTPYSILIKQFMSEYGIVDIKMRMLKIPELLKIQGFPDGYVLKGNQSEQKKFIGNAQPPVIPKKWTEALAKEILETK